MADPGFPVGGGVDLVGGRGLPRQLHFVKFVVQNERIGSLRGARAGSAPLNPPMEMLPRMVSIHTNLVVSVFTFCLFNSAQSESIVVYE